VHGDRQRHHGRKRQRARGAVEFEMRNGGRTQPNSEAGNRYHKRDELREALEWHCRFLTSAGAASVFP